MRGLRRGLLAIILNLMQDPILSAKVPHWLAVIFRLPWPAGMFAWGAKVPGFSGSNTVAVVMFLALAVSLFVSARKKLNN